jgi:folate-dependent tRNA-U54 methylase TrmFO/GidA
MNANFGLLPPLEKRLRGRDKRRAMAERALEAACAFALTAAENRA